MDEFDRPKSGDGSGGSLLVAYVCLALAVGLMWTDTRGFVFRGSHNAIHFGLGRGGWILVLIQLFGSLLVMLGAALLSLRSRLGGVGLMQVSVCMNLACMSVFQWHRGESADPRVWVYWTWTIASSVLLALVLIVHRGALQRPRTERT